MTTLKKWIPFIVMITMALIALVNLVLFTDADYKPDSSDPDLIYYQACSDCHGDNGRGSGILYPALDSLTSAKDIEEIISSGGWLMPKFKHIHGDTLKKLVNYIHKRKYLE